MTLLSAIALFFAMLVSALIPGPSVMTVVSRSITSGVKSGLMVTLGVLLADYIFIALALSGLLAVASLLGELSVYLKYIGALYLMVIAYFTWRADVSLDQPEEQKNTGLISNGIMGLLVGISNPKAILFYMGFFPAFVELSSIGFYEALTIMMIASFAIGGVLAMYACAGAKARNFIKGDKGILNKISSGILASCGALLVLKA
ncbi:hypothetical protein MED121_12255 [Marinomonas sp. MED121]|uniref:LysE family translocator n=1 Tax=Marinomonas sp. MED121 TaxID=314277 RepID=UPI000068FFFC|nr:LysE family translocator [Marinomonas sp. MED121]EAQ66697.1 hypothetical protein MED121_12255 [Marinomonas sp. MED121]